GRGLVETHRPARQFLRKRVALEVLHHEVRGAILLPDVVERADTRMIQLRDDARLTVEPLAELRIAGERLREDLDRDSAVEARVARLVHLPHAARAERREDFVRAEAAAGGEGHTGGVGTEILSRSGLWSLFDRRGGSFFTPAGRSCRI